ncbi:MAG: hypothetical protein WAQ27_05180 [Candidatus Microsaccharimonas sp.]
MPTITKNFDQTATPERQKTNSWDEAERIVTGFQFEPDFIAHLMAQDVSPSDPTTSEYIDSISAYADSYIDVHTQDETLSEDLAAQVQLVANAALFVERQKELSHYEAKLRHTRRLPDDEWRYFQDTLMPYVIWYNQRLSDYVYAHPDDKLSAVNRALTTTALNSHPHDAEAVEHSVTDTMRGARKDAVTRQLLDIAGVPYRPGSQEEDRKGGDIIVTYKGHDVKFDIKSSLIAIADERGGYDEIAEKHLMYAINKRKGEKVSDHVVKLYPGFEDIDLGDSLGINPDSEFARTRSTVVAGQIMRALNELGLNAE